MSLTASTVLSVTCRDRDCRMAAKEREKDLRGTCLQMGGAQMRRSGVVRPRADVLARGMDSNDRHPGAHKTVIRFFPVCCRHDSFTFCFLKKDENRDKASLFVRVQGPVRMIEFSLPPVFAYLYRNGKLRYQVKTHSLVVALASDSEQNRQWI